VFKVHYRCSFVGIRTRSKSTILRNVNNNDKTNYSNQWKERPQRSASLEAFWCPRKSTLLFKSNGGRFS